MSTELLTEAADGWSIGGLLSPAADDAGTGAGGVPGVVLVPGSRHERDAYTTIADHLAQAGLASLRIDVRGRGSSLGRRRYAQMAPGERRRVALDVAAALDAVATTDGVDATKLAVIAEQDTAADALAAAAADQRVAAVVVISARRAARVAAGIAARPVPVLGLVSNEDTEGLRGTVDAYLAGTDGGQLHVFDGLGFGTTMLSTRQFEHPDLEPIESIIASWLAAQLR